ncbi:uncharacterized protein SPPG_08224 [Spizellomyces punctatus DAOM BR117]|uniref:Uncharacterized protein n=1 Tax=Spizellomyces punctatus (strain DAOM BR117) TaxID=645134 RepID=A0A0L0H6G1_SPIPD|nr:uncharacterized protein SPPG_08224 [Spizellomyces punctatus DAOM BR117]KNC96318.1 hypothetical protein SPPG_08224 [Spizellomyces punctatus DAOM BR117]|eukprot:XP_016604358.1 hypothetical protein SPPG_08224 [Spizellomyces punctatus DAOM BR117]
MEDRQLIPEGHRRSDPSGISRPQIKKQQFTNHYISISFSHVHRLSRMWLTFGKRNVIIRDHSVRGAKYVNDHSVRAPVKLRSNDGTLTVGDQSHHTAIWLSERKRARSPSPDAPRKRFLPIHDDFLSEDEFPEPTSPFEGDPSGLSDGEGVLSDNPLQEDYGFEGYPPSLAPLVREIKTLHSSDNTSARFQLLFWGIVDTADDQILQLLPEDQVKTINAKLNEILFSSSVCDCTSTVTYVMDHLRNETSIANLAQIALSTGTAGLLHYFKGDGVVWVCLVRMEIQVQWVGRPRTVKICITSVNPQKYRKCQTPRDSPKLLVIESTAKMH